MNYSEIIQASLGYADRKDNKVSDQMDTFIGIVESRMNRHLTVSEQSVRTRITPKNEYIGLPNDFKAIRELEIYSEDGPRVTIRPLNPEQLNLHKTFSGEDPKYVIIADQLQLVPSQIDKAIEMVYYQKVPNLNSTDNVNWVSQDYPDCYIFGLLVEINSFIKDANATKLWNERFMNVIEELISSDSMDRWSGTPMTVQVN